jgi:hypothetical protein
MRAITFENPDSCSAAVEERAKTAAFFLIYCDKSPWVEKAKMSRTVEDGSSTGEVVSPSDPRLVMGRPSRKFILYGDP